MGAPTRLETGIVLVAKFGIRGKTSLARFLHEFGVETVPFDEEHANVTYATAYFAREPLLCIGNDFVQTDLQLVPLAV